MTNERGADQRYIVTYQPGPFWHVDGPHDDTQLAAAYGRLSTPQPVVLELTVPAVGVPRAENVTAKAVALTSPRERP